jgi:hypothetical protein
VFGKSGCCIVLPLCQSTVTDQQTNQAVNILLVNKACDWKDLLSKLLRDSLINSAESAALAE